MPPPIRAVCRHEFGQRVNIIRAKDNTCLNNTNLGSVTGVNGKKPNLGSVTVGKGKNSATPQNMDPGKVLPLPPPPTEYGSRIISATPPPLNPFGQNSVCPPPQMDVGPYAYGYAGPILWNSFPQKLRQLPSEVIFKKKLNSILLATY